MDELLTELNRIRKLSTLNEMMSFIPTTTTSEGDPNTDQEMLRAAMVSELDAINLYEQMAANTSNEKLKKLFLDVAKEEKTHVGEFEAMLLELDGEQGEELKAGEQEVNDLNT